MSPEERNEHPQGIESLSEQSGEMHTPRAQDNREANPIRESDAWLEASKLPTPTPRAGWSYRYIRLSSHGQNDNANVSQRFREGWVAASATEHPELKIVSDLNPQFEDAIIVGGLMLCRISDERVEARRKHHDIKNAQQMEAVDSNYMKEQDPRMPTLSTERKSRTSFG